jgi:hypothetical protein
VLAGPCPPSLVSRVVGMVGTFVPLSAFSITSLGVGI